MSFPITAINASLPIQQIQPLNGAAQAGGGDFKNVLHSAIQEVESSRNKTLW